MTASPHHPVVLACDVAKNRTGWAVGSHGMARPFWGVFDLQGEWEGHQGARLTEWREFIHHRVLHHAVTHIAIEKPFVDFRAFSFGGTESTLMKIGVAAQLGYSMGVKVALVTIQQWRAHFLGSAVAPKHLAEKQRTPWLKDMAMKRAAERGWLAQFHDEADALGIMDYALAALDPDYDHAVGPVTRRVELKAEIAAFRGEAPR